MHTLSVRGSSRNFCNRHRLASSMLPSGKNRAQRAWPSTSMRDRSRAHGEPNGTKSGPPTGFVDRPNASCRHQRRKEELPRLRRSPTNWRDWEILTQEKKRPTNCGQSISFHGTSFPPRALPLQRELECSRSADFGPINVPLIHTERQPPVLGLDTNDGFVLEISKAQSDVPNAYPSFSICPQNQALMPQSIARVEVGNSPVLESHPERGSTLGEGLVALALSRQRPNADRSRVEETSDWRGQLFLIRDRHGA